MFYRLPQHTTAVRRSVVTGKEDWEKGISRTFVMPTSRGRSARPPPFPIERIERPVDGRLHAGGGTARWRRGSDGGVTCRLFGELFLGD